MPFIRDASGRLRYVDSDVPTGDVSAPPAPPSRLAEFLDTKRIAESKPDNGGSSLRDWLALGARGASGFVSNAGGLVGAGAGALGELLGQTIEDRDEYNWSQVGAQGVIGAVPFGKAASLAKTLAKGAMHGAGAAGLTEYAETGAMPGGDTLVKGAAIGAGGGALADLVGGALRRRNAPPPKPIGFKPEPSQPARGYRQGYNVPTAADEAGLAHAGVQPREHGGPIPVRPEGDLPARGYRTPYRPNTADMTPEIALQRSFGVEGAEPSQPRLPNHDPAPIPPPVDVAPTSPSPALSRLLKLSRRAEAEPEGLSAHERAAIRAERAARGQTVDVSAHDAARYLDEYGQAIPPGSTSQRHAAHLEEYAQDQRYRHLISGPDVAPLPPSPAVPTPTPEPSALRAMLESAVDDSAAVGPGPKRSTKIAADVLDKGVRAKPPVGVTERRYTELMDMFGGRRATDTRGPLPTWGSEAGEISPELLQTLGSAGAGAAFGAYEDENDLRGAIAGGVLGAALPHAAKSPLLERIRFASMLSSPLTHLKNTVGVAGQATAAGLERSIAEGSAEPIVRTLRELVSPETLAAGKRAFDDPTTVSKVSGPGIPTTGTLSVPGRLLGAEDAAGRSALQRAGFSADEAERTMLAGDPQTVSGRKTLEWQRSTPLTRFVMPFARTAINLAEQGVERLDPRPLFDSAAPSTTRRLTAGRLGLSALAAFLGAKFQDSEFATEHPKLAPFALSALGPYALAGGMGMGAGKALGAGTSPIEGAVSGVHGVSEQLPLVSDYALSPSRALASYVPNAVRDLNPDDVERDTSEAGILGAMLAKIPGVSQTLPAKTRKRKRHRID